MRVTVSEYYKDELLKFMPEEMFDILDEAYFNKKSNVKVPKYLIDKLEKNRYGKSSKMS